MPDLMRPTFDPDRLAAVAASGLHAAPSLQLDRLTRLASELVGVPVGLISIVDDQRQFFASQCGLTGDVAEARQTPVSQAVCATVVDRGAPLVIDDLGADPEFAHHPARTALNVESYCGVPVIDPSGEVLGSLCLVDSVPHNWTDRDVRLLQTLATFVTETIAVHQSYVRLIADAQERLIPKQVDQPAVGAVQALYRAVPYTSGIGGDFYDTRLRSDGGFDVLVGDAVGHGIECATAAAQLRAAAITALEDLSLSPADVVRRVSAVANALPGCISSALIVARIDAEGSEVRWCRSGAMPPVVSSALGSGAHNGGANAPLGVIDPEADIDEGTVVLEPGDRIAFFTDGLIEQRGEDLVVGLKRLAAALASSCGVDELVELTCPRDEQQDDLAIVIWQR